jgi:hypothetical protein
MAVSGNLECCPEELDGSGERVQAADRSHLESTMKYFRDRRYDFKIFSPKIGKIEENCDHNIDPWSEFV